MKRFIHVLFFTPLIIWNLLTVVEIIHYLNKEHTPIYWRAWEYVSNYEGKDANFAPFKPLAYYSSTGEGDLLNAVQYTPKPDEIYHQEFVVDEYGYRNKPGFLEKPVDAVMIGSSFIAGAATSQEDTLPEILTREHGIRTYNYSTSLQYFWEDPRFTENTPQYAILVGTEGEIISSLWKFAIVDRPPNNHPKKWNSYAEWKNQNETFPRSFEKLSPKLKDFSIIRHYSLQTYLYILNSFYSREEIARSTTQHMVSYDSKAEILYFQADYDVPLLGTPGKTPQDIQTAILAYTVTQKMLNERNIRLIIVAMPSKTHLEMEKYQSLSNEEDILKILNDELKNAELEVVDVYDPLFHLRKEKKQPLYSRIDSHWGPIVNYFLADQIATYLKK